MHTETIVFAMFLIFTGAAIVATLVLYTHQSLLVAYMLLGALIGPWGLGLVNNPEMIKQIGDIGIIFLLFLLGLHLQPQNLIHMLRKVSILGVVSSIVFALIGYIVASVFGFSHIECMIIGAASMFSSTIIGLKLLPTTILHHRHTGEVMISVLLMQDILAIIVLLLIHGESMGGLGLKDVIAVMGALPALILFSFLVEKFILVKLIAKFDRTQEYIFLLSIGWCLGMTQLAGLLGLSEEIGAFIAGVALAASPISLYIAESLKPLRDFFLVMFFFSIGAGFDLSYVHIVWLPASILAVIFLAIKPVLYYFLLRQVGEARSVSREVGVRLGQTSEFSLMIAALAYEAGLISDGANYLIQATTIITFIVSSYFVVLKYPTPIALSEKMQRD